MIPTWESVLFKRCLNPKAKIKCTIVWKLSRKASENQWHAWHTVPSRRPFPCFYIRSRPRSSRGSSTTSYKTMKTNWSLTSLNKPKHIVFSFIVGQKPFLLTSSLQRPDPVLHNALLVRQQQWRSFIKSKIILSIFRFNYLTDNGIEILLARES